ncbi:TadE/TadG family type IV pilus assembly protein [Agromyces sp. Marseille-P2726]|uniref:TadE/TadG family type IV pilus assembly protein n=1 Tax=Agromyces sp. Marseille-P2726 TaxID=2709132 RepID=UPI00156D7393|nr:TadE family protein [Agromyces sp. Marseille-P2726]
MIPNPNDRGSAAVEFAMVLPLVIMLLVAVIEFSRLWNIQATISDGARIAARYAAVHSEDPTVIDDAKAEARAIPGMLDWDTATIDVNVDCDGAKSATSTITIPAGSMTGWFSSLAEAPITLSATGKMPCGE